MFFQILEFWFWSKNNVYYGAETETTFICFGTKKVQVQQKS